MKKLNTSLITTGIGYPPSKKGWDFLMESYTQVLNVFPNMLTGASAGAFALWGCDGVVSGGFCVANNGWLYDSVTDEIYYFAGCNVAITDTAVFKLKITADATADPTIMTDGSIVNIHNVRTVEVVDGASGSQMFDFSSLIYNFSQWQVVGGGGSLPAYQSSFIASTISEGVKYKIDHLNNKVSFKGGVQRATESSSVIFTLPASYRPLVNRYINTVVEINGVLIPAAVAIAATTGQVNVGFNAGSGVDVMYVFFDGVEFYIS